MKGFERRGRRGRGTEGREREMRRKGKFAV